MKFYLLLFFRLTFLGIIIFPVAYLGAFILLELISYAHFDWQKIITQFPIKKMIVCGGIVVVANWVNFILKYRRSVIRGIKSIEVLVLFGYKAQVNSISPNIKIPFYKINNDFFYNYSPTINKINIILKEIKKIIKNAEHKNIVINLIDSPVTFKDLRKKIFTNFNNEFNKIIIIDKTMNVIKIKDGDWLNINSLNLLYQCPCCGNHTLNQQGKEEVCSICSWIDDPLQTLDPDYKNGDNKISLNQARLKCRKSSC
ncbi:CPCC family cysteine-rich protein [Orbus wheelerorum]|uniref:CPCC family cysteine-rich protein n=1 Tax=Orbus wheelerorum TaxID=3074111 RepID=UPI00370D0B7F